MKKRSIALALLTAMTLAACGNNGNGLSDPVKKDVDIPFQSSASSSLTSLAP